ncbi:hypothetical protein PR048_022388 [Dryococelus australis]|uniref:Uncharacterized protein n=1 Tax=Dryococelus australis TaxID=614101 RepID=A0ABQ9H0X8_9NEOP|nr:hypothetical protein PR048_022388 [Dryococelus australis]
MVICGFHNRASRRVRRSPLETSVICVFLTERCSGDTDRAAVAERLDYSPPYKANQVTPGFSHVGIVRGQCHWSAGFSRGSPISGGAAPCSPPSPFTGSQDLAVKSRPYLVTRSRLGSLDLQLDNGEVTSLLLASPQPIKSLYPLLSQSGKWYDHIKATATPFRPSWLDYSPPTQANRVRSPAGSLADFRVWKSCQTIPLVSGFSRGSPCSVLISAALIGSQDLDHIEKLAGKLIGLRLVETPVDESKSRTFYVDKGPRLMSGRETQAFYEESLVTHTLNVFVVNRLSPTTMGEPRQGRLTLHKYTEVRQQNGVAGRATCRNAFRQSEPGNLLVSLRSSRQRIPPAAYVLANQTLGPYPRTSRQPISGWMYGRMPPHFCIHNLFCDLELLCGSRISYTLLAPLPRERRHPPNEGFSSWDPWVALIPGHDMTLRWSGAGMQGRGEREYPEKTRRQAVSSSTIPTCENPGGNPSGIEPGSQRWEASALTTTAPLSHICQCLQYSLNISFLCSYTCSPLAVTSNFSVAQLNCRRKQFPCSEHTLRDLVGNVYLLTRNRLGSVASTEIQLRKQRSFKPDFLPDSSALRGVEWSEEIRAALNSEVLRADGREVRGVWSSTGMKGRVKREIPKKTRRSAASSVTFPICENPGATPPGNESGLPRWEASSLTTTPLRPLNSDKIEAQHMYSEIPFAIGSQFIRRVLDDSKPKADWKGNEWCAPYCQVWGNTGYSLGQ